MAGHDGLLIVVAALGHTRRQVLAHAFTQERARYEVSDPSPAALCQAIALLPLEAPEDDPFAL